MYQRVHYKTSKELANEFAKDFKNHVNGLFYYGDPSGKKRDTRVQQGGNDFTILHNALKDFYPKDKVLKSAPSIIARGNFINSIFDNRIEDCEIIIDENCKELMTDLMNLKEDADGKKLKEKTTHF
jgi:hypothetical protein